MRRSMQEAILKELQQIRYRLDDIENMVCKKEFPQAIAVDADILSLPEHLRKSFMIIAQFGKCSAVQVANKIGLSRSTESKNLNELVRLGWLHKHRENKTAMFCLVERKCIINASAKSQH